MKNIFTILATSIAISTTVTAQTLDFSGLDTALINSSSGQVFNWTAADSTTGTVTFKQLSGETTLLLNGRGNDGLDFYHRTASGAGSAVYQFTFSSTVNITVYGEEALGNATFENVTLDTDGSDWNLLSSTDLAYTDNGQQFFEAYAATIGPGAAADYTIASNSVQTLTWTYNYFGAEGAEAIGIDIIGSVPEPSSTALLGIGALGLIGRRKR